MTMSAAIGYAVAVILFALVYRIIRSRRAHRDGAKNQENAE